MEYPKSVGHTIRHNTLDFSGASSDPPPSKSPLAEVKQAAAAAKPTPATIFSPRRPRRGNTPTSQPDYMHEGEGSDMASVQKIAATKQLTSANLDRWKRTFQNVRSMIRSDAENGGEDHVELNH